MKNYTADGYEFEELEGYSGATPRPADFDEYWKKAVEEVDKIDPDVNLDKAEYICGSAECFNLSFTGVGGARVTAKYLRPKTEGKHRCVFWFHGYTMSSVDWTMYLPYIAENLSVVSMDCRGEGSDSQDNQGCSAWNLYGLVLRGIREGAEHLAFKRIIQDSLELAKIVEKFPEVDERHMFTSGTSQGGALSVALSALHGGMEKTICGSNFMTDFAGVIEHDYINVTSNRAYNEIGQYLRRFDPRHEHMDKLINDLGYIDGLNFAPLVENPVLMCLTLKDRQIPPSAQMALYNRFRGPKKSMVYYDYDHEDALPGWYDASMEFLNGKML